LRSFLMYIIIHPNVASGSKILFVAGRSFALRCWGLSGVRTKKSRLLIGRGWQLVWAAQDSLDGLESPTGRRSQLFPPGRLLAAASAAHQLLAAAVAAAHQLAAAPSFFH